VLAPILPVGTGVSAGAGGYVSVAPEPLCSVGVHSEAAKYSGTNRSRDSGRQPLP